MGRLSPKQIPAPGDEERSIRSLFSGPSRRDQVRSVRAFTRRMLRPVDVTGTSRDSYERLRPTEMPFPKAATMQPTL